MASLAASYRRYADIVTRFCICVEKKTRGPDRAETDPRRNPDKIKFAQISSLLEPNAWLCSCLMSNFIFVMGYISTGTEGAVFKCILAYCVILGNVDGTHVVRAWNVPLKLRGKISPIKGPVFAFHQAGFSHAKALKARGPALCR